jgi:hypothetical protein
LHYSRTDYLGNKLGAALVHFYGFHPKAGSFGEIQELSRARPYLEDATFSREALNRFDLETLALGPTLQVV